MLFVFRLLLYAPKRSFTHEKSLYAAFFSLPWYNQKHNKKYNCFLLSFYASNEMLIMMMMMCFLCACEHNQNVCALFSISFVHLKWKKKLKRERKIEKWLNSFCSFADVFVRRFKERRKLNIDCIDNVPRLEDWRNGKQKRGNKQIEPFNTCTPQPSGALTAQWWLLYSVDSFLFQMNWYFLACSRIQDLWIIKH